MPVAKSSLSSRPWLDHVLKLKGVGPSVVASLERLGLKTIQDLWFHLPLRYEDRTHLTPFSDLLPGQTAYVEGTVERSQHRFQPRIQWQILLTDKNGESLRLRFFHFHPAQTKSLKTGMRLRCFGEVRSGFGGMEMIHPQYQRVNENTPLDNTLTPVYPTTSGLGQKRLSKIILQSLDYLPDEACLELIPSALLDGLALGTLHDALHTVHQPPAGTLVESLRTGRHPALKRLVFEELLAHHMGLRQLRHRIREWRAYRLVLSATFEGKFLSALPFQLTQAQQRVLGEIKYDIALSSPMLRLVQGDVGSGKTVVAALAALAAVESGYQVAVVAPTELLAEQHLVNFKKWFAAFDIPIHWLAGKVQGRARKDVLSAIAEEGGIVVGTHALMQEGVRFSCLGLVIVDEQHRFGVHQRLMLRDKGKNHSHAPHQLVLTATPIPRTLAMSAYADLDVSRIDELPPGRQPVKTVAISQARRNEVIERIRLSCQQGRQAYWVCTLIETSPQLQAQAAEDVHEQLVEALPDVSVGLVHGRMNGNEKQEAMTRFKSGDMAVLVATTVIEVGMDVPGASLMVIDNAERLGLSQLHQLRGRVGRGQLASSCVLLYQAPLSALARQRLTVMRETNDGFEIAEKDLSLRGPGEVLGTRQTGQMVFRVADLERDAALLADIKRVSHAMFNGAEDKIPLLIKRWMGDAMDYADA